MYGEEAIAPGGETIDLVHPVSFLLLLCIGVCIVFSSKRIALVAVLYGTVMIPMSQNLQIIGLNFMVTRIIIILGAFRAVIEAQRRRERFTPFDWVFLSWVVANCVVFSIQWGTMGAVVNRSGFFVDTMGAFVLFRFLCTDRDDAMHLARHITYLTLALAFLMAVEYTTGRNLFSFFGGVPENTEVREGRLRCEGPFPHPIYSGTFGAVVFGLIYWLRYDESRPQRLLSNMGIAGSVVMVYTSSCSGPALGLACSIGGLCFWRFRRYLRFVIFCSLGLLGLAGLLMNGPIWSLLAKVGIFGGSTGWHRYQLVDNAIKYFSDWALIGIKSTDYWGWGQWDVTNTYIKQGVQGGMVTLGLFMLVFVLGLNMAWSIVRKGAGRQSRMVGWCLGVGLFVHAVIFLGMDITWGTTRTIMCLFLAITASIYKNVAVSRV